MRDRYGMLAFVGCALTAIAVNGACNNENLGFGQGAEPFYDPCNSHSCNTSGPTSSYPASAATVDATIVTLATNESIACMAVDDDAVYWTRPDGRIAGLSTSNVPSVGAPIPAFTTTNANLQGQGCGMVRDGNFLYVTSYQANAILRIRVEKTADFTVQFDDAVTMSGFTTPSSIAVDAQYIYVTEAQTKSIHRLAKASDGDAGASADAGALEDAGDAGDGGSSDVFPGTGDLPTGLVVDDTSLYWEAGGLYKMPKTGGTAERISDKPGVVHSIAGTLFYQCFYQLCSLPVAGGITTAVSIPTGDGSITPEVHGLGFYNNDLYFADGEQMHNLSTADEALFQYSDSPLDIPFLFGQPRRLVWSDGTTIYTHGAIQQ